MSTKLTSVNRPVIYLALLALLALGLWLRLRFIHTVQLYPDEFVTLLAVQMILEKGAPLMPSGLFYEHGLLFSYLGTLAAWLGPARLTVRYASLLFGLLSLGLTFYLGRRWFSAAVGLIAVTGLAVAPAAIEWSSRARMYALLQLLILLTLWLAYEGLAQNRAGLRWASLAAYLGATLTHFVAVTLAPPLVLAGLAHYGWNRARRQPVDGVEPAGSGAKVSPRPFLLEAAALALILGLAFGVKRAGQPKGIDKLDASAVLPGLGQVFSLYSDFSFDPIGGWQAISPFYLSLPALIFVPFALLAVGRGLFSAAAGPQRFLSLILLLTTLEMVLFVSPDRRDDKYLFMLLPVLFLLGGQGLAGLAGLGVALKPVASVRPLLAAILPLLISGLILIVSQAGVSRLLANTGDDYDAAFAYVQRRWQAGDTIFSGTPAAAAFYLGQHDFYGVQRRGGYDYRLLNVNGQAVDRWLGSPAVRTEAELHQVLANHKVWLVLERWGLQREYYDLPFQQQLLAQTQFETETQGIFILRAQENPRPLPLDPAQPLKADFGGLVDLIGYTVEPARPAPGESLRLILYWQAVQPLAHDYTVFVHLRQPGGPTVTQADHRPLGQLYPTSLWPPGEIIRESSQLPLPGDLPAGDYELWVGLYRLETGERLPLQGDTSGENALKLGTLTLGK